MAKRISKRVAVNASVPPATRTGRAKNPDFRQLSAYIPKQLHTEFKMAAIQEGREISDLVETFVRVWLKTRARP